MQVTTITACRACGSARLETVLDLGSIAVSDFPATATEHEDRAPLELVVCLDCSLVQLRHTVERDRLYRSYWYRSSTQEAMVKALRDVVDDACSRVRFSSSDAVLDIGANDGTMLRMFPKYVTRIGYEPSNMALEARQGDEVILREYFPPSYEPFRQFKVITSVAMFYDLDDPGAFVAAISRWLHPEGVWVVQFQDLRMMLACNGFDNICHEHLTYWDVEPFLALLSQHGLRVEEMQGNATNGGSVRYIVRHGEQALPVVKYGDVFQQAFRLIAFGREVEHLKGELVALLRRLKLEGKTVLGYGASTKGNTLLQYCGIGPDLLPAIADRNSDKWGRVTAGTHIPIISEAEARDRKPDYFLALPWHFIDSFVQRESEFVDRGGRFIVPLPELRLEPGGDICLPNTVGATCASV
jgi:SAM-dependent methyltransferase